jgi:hypothetical protein
MQKDPFSSADDLFVREEKSCIWQDSPVSVGDWPAPVLPQGVISLRFLLIIRYPVSVFVFKSLNAEAFPHHRWYFRPPVDDAVSELTCIERYLKIILL